LYELEQRGVTVKSMTEPFDTDSPAGRYFITNLAAMAALDRENIMQRLNDGKDRAAKKGKWINGIVPYGYILNENQEIEVYEPEAKVVRMIYHLIAECNYGTTKVADYLNMLGIPTVSQGRGKRRKSLATVWTNSRIRNLVHLTVYKGKYIFRKCSRIGREPITVEVPPIVSEEIWEKATKTLRHHQRWANKNKRHSYLLSGLIRCGICGLMYIGTTTTTNKGKLGYYRCGGKIDYRGKLLGKCHNRYVRQMDIERNIWNLCLSLINNPEEAIRELVATSNTEVQNIEQEKITLEKALKDKEKERQKILELYRKGIITQDDVEQQFELIARERKQIEFRIKEIKKIQTQTIKEKELRDKLETLLKQLHKKAEKLNFEKKREIIKLVIKEVVVYPDDIQIRWAFTL
jgi:site-specific DNA recombinase